MYLQLTGHEHKVKAQCNPVCSDALLFVQFPLEKFLIRAFPFAVVRNGEKRQSKRLGIDIGWIVQALFPKGCAEHDFLVPAMVLHIGNNHIHFFPNIREENGVDRTFCDRQLSFFGGSRVKEFLRYGIEFVHILIGICHAVNGQPPFFRHIRKRVFIPFP